MRHGRGTKCTLPFTTNSHYGPMGMYARSSFSKLFLSFLCFACFLLSINIFFSLCIFRIQIILGSDAVYQSFAEIISDASTDLSIQWIGVSFYYCRYYCCCFSLVVAVVVYRAQFCFVLVHGLFNLLLLLYFVCGAVLCFNFIVHTIALFVNHSIFQFGPFSPPIIIIIFGSFCARSVHIAFASSHETELARSTLKCSH